MLALFRTSGKDTRRKRNKDERITVGENSRFTFFYAGDQTALVEDIDVGQPHDAKLEEF